MGIPEKVARAINCKLETSGFESLIWQSHVEFNRAVREFIKAQPFSMQRDRRGDPLLQEGEERLRSALAIPTDRA